MKRLISARVITAITGCFNSPNSPQQIASKIQEESYCKIECGKVHREFDKITHPIFDFECLCKDEANK